VRLNRLQSTSVPASREVIDAFGRIAGLAGARVRLMVSQRIGLPVTFTWWRPVILLPVELCDEGDLALRFCLAHERSHIEAGFPTLAAGDVGATVSLLSAVVLVAG